MRRFPLSRVCSTPGCPAAYEPEYSEWHRCWAQGIRGHRCFGGLTHCHLPKKGMGGHNSASKIVACLCAGMHDAVDNGFKYGNAVILDSEGREVYRLWEVTIEPPGKTLIERVIDEGGGKAKDDCEAPASSWRREGGPKGGARDRHAAQLPAPLSDHPPEALPIARSKSEARRLTAQTGLTITVQDEFDWTSLSDEALVIIYLNADRQQADGFLTKCHAIHTYRMRHDDWLESAYDLFHASRRTLYAYSNVYEICATSDTHIVENIGPLTDSRSLMQFIGRKSVEEGRVALEAAVAHLAEYGEPPTVAALIHRLGEEATKPEEGCHHSWKCELCGATR